MPSHFPDAVTTGLGAGAGTGYAAVDGGEGAVVDGGGVEVRGAETLVDVEADVVDARRVEEVVA